MMNHDYADIRALTAAPPKWFDEHAVPRYCGFAAREVSDIYADEVVLAEIACQGCQTLFQVAFSASPMSRLVGKQPPLAEQILSKTLHYGDPPNVGCCATGPTMNSEPQRVLEFWRRPKGKFDWERDSALEVDVQQPWMRGGDEAPATADNS